MASGKERSWARAVREWETGRLWIGVERRSQAPSLPMFQTPRPSFARHSSPLSPKRTPGTDWHGHFYSILFIDYYWRWTVFHYSAILKDAIAFSIFPSSVSSCLSCKLKKKTTVANSENTEKSKFTVTHILCHNLRLDTHNCLPSQTTTLFFFLVKVGPKEIIASYCRCYTWKGELLFCSEQPDDRTAQIPCLTELTSRSSVHIHVHIVTLRPKGWIT